MLRGFGAPLAVLALLFGLSSAAPYTHAHRAIASASDEHHPKGDSLVHTHSSPHAHHDADHPDPEPAGDEDREDQIWSVNNFVFQQSPGSPAPPPVLLVFGELHVPLTSRGFGVDRPSPRAHGPPIGSPPGLRAPPASLPTLA